MSKAPDQPPLVSGAETLARIERLLAGKSIDAPEIFDAGTLIPRWYGVQTAAEVSAIWLRMWDRMKDRCPLDEVFYLGNAAQWAKAAAPFKGNEP